MLSPERETWTYPMFLAIRLPDKKGKLFYVLFVSFLSLFYQLPFIYYFYPLHIIWNTDNINIVVSLFFIFYQKNFYKVLIFSRLFFSLIFIASLNLSSIIAFDLWCCSKQMIQFVMIVFVYRVQTLVVTYFQATFASLLD